MLQASCGGACVCSGRGRVCSRAPQPTAVERAKASTAGAFRICHSRGALEAPQQELEVARAQAVGGLLHTSERREKEYLGRARAHASEAGERLPTRVRRAPIFGLPGFAGLSRSVRLVAGLGIAQLVVQSAKEK